MCPSLKESHSHHNRAAPVSTWYFAGGDRSSTGGASATANLTPLPGPLPLPSPAFFSLPLLPTLPKPAPLVHGDTSCGPQMQCQPHSPEVQHHLQYPRASASHVSMELVLNSSTSDANPQDWAHTLTPFDILHQTIFSPATYFFYKTFYSTLKFSLFHPNLLEKIVIG